MNRKGKIFDAPENDIDDERIEQYKAMVKEKEQ